MKALICLQLGYLLGFVCMPLAGSKRRPGLVPIGWGIGLLSEVAFAGWATWDHVWSAYPWIVAWAAVYSVNWIKWRKNVPLH